MNANFVGMYTKSTGTKVYKYALNVNATELTALKEAQGDFYTEGDDGRPLWFSVNFVTKNPKVNISSKGNLYADMSEFDQAVSLAEQYKGTALGAELAKQAAIMLLGNTTAAAPVAAAPAPVAVEQAAELPVTEEPNPDF